MKVNELEKLLNIPRASIRFYEKEGLLEPARNENGYRDYSNDDLQRVKTIIVLRKMGMSIGNIRELLAGNITLSDAVTDSISDLRKQLVEINGALALCNELLDSKISVKEFDANAYWDKISEAETAGASFASIAEDLIEYEIKSLGWGHLVDENLPANKQLLHMLIEVGIISVIVGLTRWVMFGQGLLGFLSYPLSFAIYFAVVAIVFFIERKNQRVGRIMKQMIFGISVAFIVFMVCVVIVLLLNGKLHFLF